VVLVILLGVVLFFFFLATNIFGNKIMTIQRINNYDGDFTKNKPAQKHFSINFYLITILFLLIETKILYLLLWASVFRELNKINYFNFAILICFLFTLLVGHLYAIKKGILEHDEAK